MARPGVVVQWIILLLLLLLTLLEAGPVGSTHGRRRQKRQLSFPPVTYGYGLGGMYPYGGLYNSYGLNGLYGMYGGGGYGYGGYPYGGLGYGYGANNLYGGLYPGYNLRWG